MKAKIKEIEQPKQFEPFELVLTIESKNELEALWLLSNVLPMHQVTKSIIEANKWARVSTDSLDISFLGVPLFNVIDEKLSEVNNEQF